MHERFYFTYIVASQSRTLYVGVTGNLNKRVFEHKQKLLEGFLATYNCDRLVWFERFSEVDHAIEREKQLKRWRRAKKIALIEAGNPTWVDLSEGWYTKEQLEGPCGEVCCGCIAKSRSLGSPQRRAATPLACGPKRASLGMTRGRVVVMRGRRLLRAWL